MKKILRSVADLMSPNDPELVEKTLARIDQQDQWNDLFSTKLIELLDGMDSFRADARTHIVEANLKAGEAERSLNDAKVKFECAMQELTMARKTQLISQAAYDTATSISRKSSRLAILAQALSWVVVIVLATFLKRPLEPAIGVGAVVVIGIASVYALRRIR